ncbi:hypothetical protein D3C79_676540 [compost metagenome]
MDRYWTHGVMTRSMSGSASNYAQANGFTTGPSSGFGVSDMNVFDPMASSNWQTALNYNSREGVNAPIAGKDYWTGITDTGFEVGVGHYFRDSRGQNAAQLNYYAYV